MGGLLARVVDLDLLVDVVEDGLHLVLQAVQLMSFPLQLPLVLLVVLLQHCVGQTLKKVSVRHQSIQVRLVLESLQQPITELLLGTGFGHR